MSCFVLREGLACAWAKPVRIGGVILRWWPTQLRQRERKRREGVGPLMERGPGDEEAGTTGLLSLTGCSV